jgi:hypothetical protein
MLKASQSGHVATTPTNSAYQFTKRERITLRCYLENCFGMVKNLRKSKDRKKGIDF